MTYRFATFLLLLMVIALLIAGAWPAEVTPDTPACVHAEPTPARRNSQVWARLEVHP
jgi:hypothetical protein